MAFAIRADAEPLPSSVPKKTGPFIVSPRFDNAGSFSDGLAAVQVDGKWGFIDNGGEVVIEPQFNPNQAQFNARLQDGLVAVNFEDAGATWLHAPSGAARWGFADKRGVVVINPQFEGNYYSSPFFSEGLAAIRVGFKFGYIDKSGRMVIPPTFVDARWFSGGMAVVKLGQKFGYIDKSGALAIPATFDAATAFSEGLAVVTSDGKDGCIDSSGTYVNEGRFEFLGQLSDGLASFTISGVSHLDAGGRSVVSNDASEARATKEAKYGYVDRIGKVVIPPQFPVTGFLDEGFSEGLACVMFPVAATEKKSFFTDGKYGFIDKTGRLVINPTFDFAQKFSEGLAAVQVGKKYGYTDKRGHLVIEAKFDNAESFSNGAAKVQVGQKYGFIAR